MATKLLAIGHSYVLSINRAVLRTLSHDQDFEVVVAAPKQFHGDYGLIKLQAEPTDSKLCVVDLPGMWTNSPHLFHYKCSALKGLLSAGSFDVVSIWEEPYTVSGWLVAQAARRFAPKARLCFYTCQNLFKQYPLPFSWFERQTVKLADGWQASGEFVYTNLLGRGYNPNKGKVLALAVDTSLFNPLPPETHHRILASLGLQSPIIGFLGRLTPQKGVRVLLKALELLPRELSWSALFLGSGPEQAIIDQWARAKGWDDRVRVKLVQHNEVPIYLGVMDVLAAPSQTTLQWKEQFGRMIIEAFACGVPVLGSDSGEIPNVIGKAGIVVPEADASAWAQEIAGILNDTPRKEVMRKSGLERAQQFSAAILAVKYADFYRALILQGDL